MELIFKKYLKHYIFCIIVELQGPMEIFLQLIENQQEEILINVCYNFNPTFLQDVCIATMNVDMARRIINNYNNWYGKEFIIAWYNYTFFKKYDNNIKFSLIFVNGITKRILKSADDKLCYESIIENNVLHGMSKFYCENELVLLLLYDNGKLLMKFVYDDGKIIKINNINENYVIIMKYCEYKYGYDSWSIKHDGVLTYEGKIKYESGEPIFSEFDALLNMIHINTFSDVELYDNFIKYVDMLDNIVAKYTREDIDYEDYKGQLYEYDVW